MKLRFVCIILAVALLVVGSAVAADTADSINTAGKLYSDSVDLANEGKYQQALDKADQALALNVSSMTGLIQSNRAGILVMLNRNDEAIAAADAALAVEGNLTTVHSIAWYNKGNALNNLGRIAEAREAYDNAYALDNTLVPPVLTGETPKTAATQSPLSSMTVLSAVGAIAAILSFARKKR